MMHTLVWIGSIAQIIISIVAFILSKLLDYEEVLAKKFLRNVGWFLLITGTMFTVALYNGINLYEFDYRYRFWVWLLGE